jgi:hypothetical protein
LRQRASAGDEHAQQQLAELPDEHDNGGAE